jgi:lipopolysaccharide export LptBFGC system permease protein LptF
MKEFLSVIVVVLFICLLGWLFTGNSLFMSKVFSPQFEQVRRETFEQSKAYNQGVAQDISNFQQQYITATDNQKDALASVIIHRTADYDLSNLSQDQRSFIEKLRRGER